MSCHAGERRTARGGGARGRAGAEERGPRGVDGDVVRREGRAEGAQMAHEHRGAAPRTPASAAAERVRTHELARLQALARRQEQQMAAL